MLHLLQKHLDKSFFFVTNMFTGMLNYVKTLLYCNYLTLPALKGFSFCYTIIRMRLQVKGCSFCWQAIYNTTVCEMQVHTGKM